MNGSQGCGSMSGGGAVPHKENYPAQNVGSAAVEKLAPHGRTTFPTPLRRADSSYSSKFSINVTP